jgi:hypothetical protein
MRSLILRIVAVSALLLCAEARAPAQVFKLTGGASSGFQAEGAGLEVRGKDYEAWSGAGLSEGHLVFGAFLKLHYQHYTVKLGDDDISFSLPTDIFGSQSTLHTSGVALETHFHRTTLYAFTGQMGAGFASPMFRAGTSSGPLTTILFTDTLLTKKIRLFSRNIFTSAQTTISGIEWKPRVGDTLSFAAGIGSGRFYTSEAAAFVRGRFDLNLGYVAAGENFQRSLTGTPLQTELDGANVTGVVRPTRNISFSFGHLNYIAPSQGQQAALRAQVDHIGGNWKLSELSLGSAVFRSEVLNRTSRGASLWASRSVGMVDLRFNYLVSAADRNKAFQSFSLLSQEKLTSRISVLQVTTYSAGKTSVAFGGSLTTNLLSMGVDYQTYYVPFRPDKPFTQALSVHLNLNLLGNIHLSTATSFTPAGKMVYTLVGTGSYYRMSGLEATPRLEHFSFQQYLIQGRATTPNGLPVSGAAVRIGKEVVYTDSDGRFFARQRKAGRYRVEVVLNEFIATGNFAVITAPEDAEATKDQNGPGLVIVMAQVLAPRSPLEAFSQPVGTPAQPAIKLPVSTPALAPAPTPTVVAVRVSTPAFASAVIPTPTFIAAPTGPKHQDGVCDEPAIQTRDGEQESLGDVARRVRKRKACLELARGDAKGPCQLVNMPPGIIVQQ